MAGRVGACGTWAALYRPNLFRSEILLAEMAHPAPPRTDRFTISPESLRWGIGLFCSILGAFVLVAPHRFAAPPYEALAPYRALWGSAAFAAGVALLAVAVLRPRP